MRLVLMLRLYTLHLSRGRSPSSEQDERYSSCSGGSPVPPCHRTLRQGAELVKYADIGMNITRYL